MSEENKQHSIDKEQFADESVLKSVKPSKIVIPVILGVVAIVWLMLKKFDLNEFYKIEWTGHTIQWIGVAILLLVARHLLYSLRLYLISGREFTYLKCIELLFIWEFSTAVAPTNVGGAAVALFVLIQEKLSTAKTVTIVIFKVLLDSIFFLTILPLSMMIFGWQIIRPDIKTFADIGGWGYTFLMVFVLMLLQGGILFYGLFINPAGIKKLLEFFTKLPVLNRFKARATLLGDEIVVASEELRLHSWKFHLAAFGVTAMAWMTRFLLINSLIIAFIPHLHNDWYNQFLLFARISTMYIVTLFSPTPGGAGIAELVFGGFMSDFVQSTTALVIALIWRLLTYYSYLIAGVFVIPNWVNKILKK